MTSAKRSNSGRSAGRSSASPGAAEAGLEARALLACDLLGVHEGAAPILVACSGGADSAAALLLTRRARPRARLIACYVDHGVRSRASIRGDLEAVRAQAASANAEVRSIRLEPRGASPPHGVSPEAALRSKRYAALARCARDAGAACVITGHQRDDVVECALLALMRGSGVDGLAAMPPRRRLATGIMLVRPLLWAPKPVLAAYVRGRGVPVSTDETNEDTRYRRNAVRALIAQLERSVPGVSGAIGRSAAIIAEDARLLRAVAVAAMRRARSPHDPSALRAALLRALPPAMIRHVVRLFVRESGESLRDFSYAQCAAAAAAIKNGGGGTFPAGNAVLSLSGGRITVLQDDSAPHHADALDIQLPPRASSMDWCGGRIELRMRAARSSGEKDEHAASSATRVVLLDANRLRRAGRLTVRSARKGDRFRPSGRRSDVPLARFLAKQGLSRHERATVPLLCVNGEIAAVLGVRASADFIAGPRSRAVELAWMPTNAPRPRRTADV